MPEDEDPEDALVRYLDDHLSGWDVVFSKMYYRGGVPRAVVKLQDTETKDSISVNAERTSLLGKILIRIYRAKHP